MRDSSTGTSRAVDHRAALWRIVSAINTMPLPAAARVPLVDRSAISVASRICSFERAALNAETICS